MRAAPAFPDHAGASVPDYDGLLAYAPPTDLLRGRTILVTGAAAGIGRAAALACSRCGALTILLDCDDRRLRATGAAIRAAGGAEPMLCTMDLAQTGIEDLRSLAGRIGDTHGRLDGLLNNAGWIGALTPFEHCVPAVWGKVVSVNLAAPFFLTQWCVPLLRRSPDPAVVFTLHEARRAYWGAYGVAKAGLEALVHILAAEYHAASAQPMRVLGVDPGPVATDERRRHHPGERPDTHPRPESVTGPFLYALGPDARGHSGLVLRWPGYAARPQAGDTAAPAYHRR